MISLHAHGHKCFACPDGTYGYNNSESSFQQHGKVICLKCQHTVNQNLYSGDIVKDRMLVEETLDVNISLLSGEIDEVIQATKELSILYDNAYLHIQFDEEEIIGLRFETLLEKGERILAEKKKAAGDAKKEKERIDKMKERYDFLKNKYPNPVKETVSE